MDIVTSLAKKIVTFPLKCVMWIGIAMFGITCGLTFMVLALLKPVIEFALGGALIFGCMGLGIWYFSDTAFQTSTHLSISIGLVVGSALLGSLYIWFVDTFIYPDTIKVRIADKAW